MAERAAPAGSPGLARLALLALAAGIAVPLVAAGLRSLLWVLIGVAGLALAAVGAWWTLAHTGVLRVLGAALAVLAPLAVLVLYATVGMLGPALLALVLLALAVTAARAALPRVRRDAGRPVTAPARAPWILINPRSGGGKAARFGLVERAEAAGCRVALLTGGQDVTELARRAVAEGADLLAVAGGDGTQALVAGVAADHDLPFVVVPAGTRNHFALDLGLDRDDPGAALLALTDAVELRVDLGYAADRVFVNNASFGAYADVVADPAYRDAKSRTVLRSLPALLTAPGAARLGVRVGDGGRGEGVAPEAPMPPEPPERSGRHGADGPDGPDWSGGPGGLQELHGLQALLVSNNPYGRAVDAAHPGRRARLDTGRLGVVCVRVDSAAEAARLVYEPRARGVVRLTAVEIVIEADAVAVPAGIDGEHVVLAAPVVCRSAPGALRVRVPRRRPGSPRSRAGRALRAGASAADWARVTRVALGRG
ncbi:diacylglycerol/lipid kinase family protein [Streptomyces sp. NPDC059477]|uniref:diacylglycerol/lipid kinase family protein n=1 Tax=Streptomyces sp. NPDC059477 TaxID=3346847 RepID=UPI0036BDC435